MTFYASVEKLARIRPGYITPWFLEMMRKHENKGSILRETPRAVCYKCYIGREKVSEEV